MCGGLCFSIFTLEGAMMEKTSYFHSLFHDTWIRTQVDLFSGDNSVIKVNLIDFGLALLTFLTVSFIVWCFRFGKLHWPYIFCLNLNIKMLNNNELPSCKTGFHWASSPVIVSPCQCVATDLLNQRQSALALFELS